MNLPLTQGQATTPTPIDIEKPRFTDGLGNPDCPHCHGLGYVREDVPVGHPSFGKLQPCACSLEVVKSRQIAHMLSVSNIESLAGKTFETFLPEGISPNEQHRNSLNAAWKACQEFADNPTNRWLLLSGPYGCGKTHLAAAITNRLVSENKPVMFLNAADLLDYLRAAFSPSIKETYSDRFDEIKNVPVLVLDDLGAESPTRWALEKLYQIINHRYNAKLPTVVTTNRNLDRLEPRIASRLQDVNLVTHLDIAAPDFRSGKLSTRNAGLYDFTPNPRATFATFENRGDLTGDNARAFNNAVREAQRFAAEPSGWLILIGPNRSGKTHLATAIANYRIQLGKTATFVNFHDLGDLLRSSTGYGASDENDSEPLNPSISSIVWRLRLAELLVLDDLPAKLQAGFIRDKLLQILLYRLETQQPTVITTDAKLDQLDTRLGAHILSADNCAIHLLPAPPFDRRQTRAIPHWYSASEKKERR